MATVTSWEQIIRENNIEKSEILVTNLSEDEGTDRPRRTTDVAARCVSFSWKFTTLIFEILCFFLDYNPPAALWHIYI